jgi:cytochrome c peroxidase
MNDLNPGPDGAFQTRTPNAQLSAADFPLHKLADPNNPACVTSDSNDIVGSQGVINRTFTSTPASGASDPAADVCATIADPVFHVGATDTRRVTGRNAPSAVNAVFNLRNFWDGRADSVFNGVDPFGRRDPDAHIWKLVGGVLQPFQVSLEPASWHHRRRDQA